MNRWTARILHAFGGPNVRGGALALLAAVAAAAPPHAAGAAPVFAHRSVSTASARAQSAFDEGLTLLYAFNRRAARDAFARAARLDPRLAMAPWGTAMASGGNINVAQDDDDVVRARSAARAAQRLAVGASPVDRALIDAVAAAYGHASADRAVSAAALERSMRAVKRRFPNDADVAVLWAQSAMNLRPWRLYDSAGAPASGTGDIVTALQAVLRRQPGHIGANHLCIHALEASAAPERALPCARRLAMMTFAPAASHLAHMPAHAFMRSGDFARAAAVSAAAVRVAERYDARHPDDGEMRGYTLHDRTFVWAAQMAAGGRAAAERTAATLRRDGMTAPQAFTAVRFHRRPNGFAGEPAPTPMEPAAAQLFHFARGIWFARAGDLPAARRELAAVIVTPAIADVPASPGDAQRPRDIIALERLVLEARIAFAAHRYTEAIARYRAAVRLEDGFVYAEPPDWPLPVREQLGAALLRTGRAPDAAAVFEADLRRNHGNPRSLFGLRAALEAMHQTARARLVHRAFVRAWQAADGPLRLDDLL